MNTLILEVHRKKEISLYTHTKNNPGAHYILPSKWYTAWQKYLKGGPKPGRILLHTLLDSKGNVKLNLQHAKDYHTAPAKLWEYLKASYGSDQQIQCQKNNIYTNNTLEKPSRATSPSLVPSSPAKTFRGSRMIKSSSSKGSADTTRSLKMVHVRSSPDFKIKFSMSIEKKININGIVGLENTGCSCFMNTSLQCLLSLNHFVKAILKTKRAAPFLNIMKEFFMQVRSGVGNCKKISHFFKSEFPPGKQHDAPEFLRKLIDVVDKELTPKKRGSECDPWREYETNHSKLIVAFFSGMTCSKITCTKCSKKTESYEPFTSLTLEVTTSVRKSLDKYVEKETIRDQYYCNVCDQISDIEKQYSFVKSPNVLIVQLKRFVTIPFSRKINMHCLFELEIELCSINQERCLYDLKAIAVHSGSSNSGHYTAYCKRFSKWYLFDDLVYNEVESDKVQEMQAYLLIYTRKL